MHRLLGLLLVGLVGVLGSSLAACVPVGVGASVEVGPPATVVGEVGVAPGAGYVWIDGYWTWSGLRYVWVPGVWVWAADVHAMWVAPTYMWAGHHYRFVPGHWDHDRRTRRVITRSHHDHRQVPPRRGTVRAPRLRR